MDNRVRNPLIRELSRVKKELDEMIDEGMHSDSAMWRGWRVIGLPRESM